MAGDLAHAVCACSHHNAHKGTSSRERVDWAELAVDYAVQAIYSVGGQDFDLYDGPSPNAIFACHSSVVVTFLLAAGIKYFIGENEYATCLFQAAEEVEYAPVNRPASRLRR